MLERKHFIFQGQVQGVGFRITCYRIATQLKLTGWVKNLSDGTVEACVQGESIMIERLIGELKQARFIHIEHFKAESMPILEDEKSFALKY